MKFSTLFQAAGKQTVFNIYRMKETGENDLFPESICTVDKGCKVPYSVYRSDVKNVFATSEDHMTVMLNSRGADEC